MDDRDLNSIYLKYLQKTPICTCKLQCHQSSQCGLHQPSRTFNFDSHNFSNKNNLGSPPALECLIHYEPHDADPTDNRCVKKRGSRVSSNELGSSLSSDRTSSDQSDGDVEDDTKVDLSTLNVEEFENAYLTSNKAELYNGEDSGLDISDKETSLKSVKSKKVTNLRPCGSSFNKESRLTRSVPVHVKSLPKPSKTKDNVDTLSMTSLEVADIMAIPPSLNIPILQSEGKKTIRGKIQDQTDDSKIEAVKTAVKRKDKKGLNNFIEQSIRSFIDTVPENNQKSNTSSTKQQPIYNPTVVDDVTLRKNNQTLNEEPVIDVNHIKNVRKADGRLTNTISEHQLPGHISKNLNSRNSIGLLSPNQTFPSVSQPRSITYRLTQQPLNYSSLKQDNGDNYDKPTSNNANPAVFNIPHTKTIPIRTKCPSSCSGSSNNSSEKDFMNEVDKTTCNISLSTLLLSGYKIKHVKVYRRDEEFETSQYTTHIVKDSGSTCSTQRPDSSASHGSSNSKTMYSHVIVVNQTHSLNGQRCKLCPMDIIVEVNGEFVLNTSKSSLDLLLHRSNKYNIVIARNNEEDLEEDNVV